MIEMQWLQKVGESKKKTASPVKGEQDGGNYVDRITNEDVVLLFGANESNHVFV
jgi:hypothetical protein